MQLSPFPLLLVKGSYENHQVGKIGSESLSSHQGLPGEQRVGNRATGDFPEEKHHEYPTYLEERAFARMSYTFSGKLTSLHSLPSVSVLSTLGRCHGPFVPHTWGLPEPATQTTEGRGRSGGLAFTALWDAACSLSILEEGSLYSFRKSPHICIHCISLSFPLLLWRSSWT